MLLVIALVWLLCLVAPVQAEIYKWVDTTGRVHFSDTLERVPAAYRATIEAQDSTAPTLQSQPVVQRATLDRASVARPASPPSHSIPVWRDGNTMVVEALVSGSVRTRLLIDTGAEFTVLSSTAAHRIGLDLTHAAVIPLRSASGVFLAPLTKVRSLSLGEAVAYDVDVIVHDTSPELDGLLGMSFLDNFSLTIPMSEARLILTPPVADTDAGLYGGRSKDWWLRKFRFYRNQLTGLQSYLASHALPELERTRRYMQTELDTLERQATLAGVPRHWRY